MSLCYDFQKWTVMTMLAILTVCLVGMANLVYGQSPLNLTRDARSNATQLTEEGENATEKLLPTCVEYDSPALIIIDLRCRGHNSVIANYVDQGFDIKATTDTTIYLTKLK